MTITFYHTSSPHNQLQKTLTDGVSITGTLRDITNEEKPVITKIDTSQLTTANAALVRTANYAYITEFNKYYFVEPPTLRTDKLIDVQLYIDNLMTHASDILNQVCLIERSEGNISQYINDSERPAYNFPMVLTKNFSAGFEAFHMYLTVASSHESTP